MSRGFARHWAIWAALGAVGIPGCGREAAAPAAAAGRASAFPEVTAEVGLPDSVPHWPDGTFDLPEVMVGGVGLLDYDGDGDLDLLEVRYPPPGEPRAPAPNRLFRQEANGRFTDVTAASGLGDPGYGHGVAVGDADDDGDLDVYFANVGLDAYYRNNGDGAFSNATAEAGFAGDHWSTSAAFVDYDADGDLDLYVAHYVDHDPAIRCDGGNLSPEYCGPQMFPSSLDTLYRNEGGGVFTDVTAAAGITVAGNGLGVLCADFTGDGRVDIYVANDQQPNLLWVNRGDGSFVDEAVVRGVAFNGEGRTEASMGLSIGDTNGDGRFDLFMTHLRNESNTLYRADAAGAFEDVSDASRLAMVDRPFTGFGCGLVDLDLDGDLDLAIVDGRVARGRVLPGADVGEFWNLYAEPGLLFLNDGRGSFSRLDTPAGGFGSRIELGRGLAFGDLDGDGDVDLAAAHLGGPTRIFRNQAAPPGSHWLIVRALTGKRDAIGAVVEVTAGGRGQRRLVTPAYSYASSSDPRVHFGLGPADRIDAVEIVWPDGSRETFGGGAADRVLTLRQGERAP